ncbi:helix-turn-helix domain-containing protein [Ferdinandcohnia quinoae]|uniref:Helix-turn-helix domain-containing protein n=1 Tax=Fredinandcohnia quinoae TaxID=2918902 RepID=A0AAW5E0H1_9BACI|nr:helix-turn-helix domain-containing protein [Fredinandcohnia sp. SECRCQ15]MCH1625813.1 helix-turn-helix domain-containing protein [Fredinandcohnia sp. SECRCQ15]
MNTFKFETLEYVCKLLFNSYNISIFCMDNEGDLVFEYSYNSLYNPLYPSKKEFLKQFFIQDEPCHIPIFKTTQNLENYFSIKLQENKCILVGPVLYSRLSDESVKGIINDSHLKINQDVLVQHYLSLPILSHLNFINMSMVLYYMLFQQQLDLVDILQNDEMLEMKMDKLETPDFYISERRQKSSTFFDPLAEKKIFDCIKEGKTEELIKHIKSLPETVELGVLSKTSHLRSQKNLGVAIITLATRAAVDGGIYPEIAFTISDLFIQSLEELQESRAILPFVEKALIEFAERVEKGKTHKYSKPINTCLNYIFSHLYEDITLTHLAEVAEMNPSYLSSLLKKEVGVSMIEYIQRAKIDEAKSLMTYTSHTLSEISTLLNFHDQSHFIKVFKKYAGTTPNRFRNGG